mmetsp:Transcript_4284/g.9504  ORF Transcript_4284/g.9504 Transcript_4284/m.9504 type:complete len:822 (+) Transcript_4284:273-2738(+)
MAVMSSSERLASKTQEIRRVLSEPTVDLWRLRELALSDGGLVNDSLRKLAWPKLVGADVDGILNCRGEALDLPSPEDGSDLISTPSTIPHLSYDHAQIERDVSRVTWHLLTGNQRSRNFQMKNKHRRKIAQLLRKKQRRLGDYLNLTLILSYDSLVDGERRVEGSNNVPSGLVGSDDRLRYYQGFHDIGSIVLSTLDGVTMPTSPSSNSAYLPSLSDAGAIESTNAAASQMGLGLACQVLLRLSHSHLRDAMRANFHQLQCALKLIVMPLLATLDPQLHSHLRDCEMEPYFCLSWIITWFSHDIRDTSLIKRLYDCFIVSHPLLVVYMSVAMMVHPLNRLEVLGVDCDFACVHNALAELPKNSSNVGWKYTPGDGTGDGEEEGSLNDFSMMDQSADTNDEDGSVVSLNGVSRGKSRVPFQELIDLSIDMMHNIPPRNLINLAKRYHDEITLNPLIVQASSIAMLQPPPAWALKTHADSDWIVRQKVRELSGNTKLNRHQRKNRAKLGTRSDKSMSIDLSETSPSSIALVRPSLKVIIASGTGPDGRADAKRRRKKRKLIVRCAVVIFLAAAVVAFRGHGSCDDFAEIEQDSRVLASAGEELQEWHIDGDAQMTVEENEMEDKIETFDDNIEDETVVKQIYPEEETTEEVRTDYECDDNESTRHDLSALDGLKADHETDVVTTSYVDQSLIDNSVSQAFLKLVFWKSALFIRNITSTVSRKYSIKRNLNHLDHHVGFVMGQVIDVVHVAWRHARLGWKAVAPSIKKGLLSEIESGGESDLSDGAVQTWQKRHWRSPIVNIISDVTTKRSKATNDITSNLNTK